MMGKNHIITGCTATTTALAWAVTLGAKSNYTINGVDGFVDAVSHGLGMSTADKFRNFGAAVSHWILPYGPPTTPQAVIYIVIGYCLVVLGSVLPDMDIESSWAGRRLPGKVWRLLTPKRSPHRGLTHSIWPQVLFFLCAIPEPTRWMVFMFFGWATHCTMDMFSKAGRAWLYPFGKYRVVTFPNGSRCVMVYNGKGLYKTGQKSEMVFTVIVVCWYAFVLSLLLFL